MTIQSLVEQSVNRPATSPLGSSVLDHAAAAGNVVDIARFGLRNNEGMWPSYNCLDTLVPTVLCPDPLEAGAPKTFSFAEYMPGLEFAVYGGAQCQAVGLDAVDQRSEIQRVFALNEGKGVEQALLYNRFVATGSDDPIQWDAPEDVTPAGKAVSLQVALALLEGRAAAIYAGAPTIHMPRAAASFLNERIVWKDGLAFTRSGSKVAFGGGYDDETMLASGKWDLYATGEVYIERSETVDIQSWVIPGDGNGTGSDETGIAENSVISLAERMFRVAVDCFVLKATGTVWA